MKYRILLMACLGVGLLYLIGDLLLYSTAYYVTYVDVSICVAKAFAAWGFLMGSRAFKSKDYQYKIWIMLSGCYTIYLIKDILNKAILLQVGTLEVIPWIDAVLNIVSNIVFVAATWMFARTWKRTGLGHTGSKVRNTVITLSIMLLVTVLIGPALVDNIKYMFAGQVLAIGSVVSSLADMLILFITASLLLTSITLRGGIIFWPFGLYTISMFFWLLFDMTEWLTLIEFSPRITFMLQETFRVTACLLGGSAGLAQNWMVRKYKKAD
jgi:hypothetical protein